MGKQWEWLRLAQWTLTGAVLMASGLGCIASTDEGLGGQEANSAGARASWQWTASSTTKKGTS